MSETTERAPNERAMPGDLNALLDALHAERTASNTLHVDCWACEAANSAAVADALTELRRARAAASHALAVLDRAVPDEGARLELWREHWRDQIQKELPVDE